MVACCTLKETLQVYNTIADIPKMYCQVQQYNCRYPKNVLSSSTCYSPGFEFLFVKLRSSKPMLHI